MMRYSTDSYATFSIKHTKQWQRSQTGWHIQREREREIERDKNTNNNKHLTIITSMHPKIYAIRKWVSVQREKKRQNKEWNMHNKYRFYLIRHHLQRSLAQQCRINNNNKFVAFFHLFCTFCFYSVLSLFSLLLRFDVQLLTIYPPAASWSLKIRFF